MWPRRSICPHCGVVGGRVYELSLVQGTKSKKNPNGAIRYGLKRCGECLKQFTIKIGTVFERLRLPLNVALQAALLLTCSRKRITAYELHFALDVTQETAALYIGRVREALNAQSIEQVGAGDAGRNDFEGDQVPIADVVSRSDDAEIRFVAYAKHINVLDEEEVWEGILARIVSYKPDCGWK